MEEFRRSNVNQNSQRWLRQSPWMDNLRGLLCLPMWKSGGQLPSFEFFFQLMYILTSRSELNIEVTGTIYEIEPQVFRHIF